MTTHRRIYFPGKSNFLTFLLVWLISSRQVVLLYTNSTVRLFYDGQVYSQSKFENLPQNQHTEYFPIWTLIDADFLKQEHPLGRGQNVWPIQASCSNPDRFDAWHKQFGAAVFGMDVWDMPELMAGYVFSLFSFLPSRSSLTVLRFLVYIFSPNLMTFRAD